MDRQAQDRKRHSGQRQGRPQRPLKPVPPVSQPPLWAGLRSPCAAAQAELHRVVNRSAGGFLQNRSTRGILQGE